MEESDGFKLTARQSRELEYHRARAREHADLLSKPISWAVLDRPSRRWWNAYWQMYAYLTALDLKGKRVLVVGCGFGSDAFYLAKLGAQVHGFDLSIESLSLAEQIARREGLKIAFKQMPAEALIYPSDFFDCIVARDILHHVDIPRASGEILRVSKTNAILLINEIYSHSFADWIRRLRMIDQLLYPRMQRLIYGPGKPYITEDERKLNEVDVREITKALRNIELRRYFNFLVTRIMPDRYVTLSKVDRLALMALRPLAPFLAGRVLLAGRISK